MKYYIEIDSDIPFSLQGGILKRLIEIQNAGLKIKVGEIYLEDQIKINKFTRGRCIEIAARVYQDQDLKDRVLDHEVVTDIANTLYKHLSKNLKELLVEEASKIIDNIKLGIYYEQGHRKTAISETDFKRIEDWINKYNS